MLVVNKYQNKGFIMFGTIHKQLKNVKNNLRWSNKKSISANINGVVIMITLETTFDDVIKTCVVL